MDNKVKTESVAEFLARGGNVTKLSPKAPKRPYTRVVKDTTPQEPVDFTLLPMALKIRYGVR